jgi:hypothetical protein
MADVAQTTHPDHLLRANPVYEFGYSERLFYMRLPWSIGRSKVPVGIFFAETKGKR